MWEPTLRILRLTEAEFLRAERGRHVAPLLSFEPGRTSRDITEVIRAKPGLQAVHLRGTTSWERLGGTLGETCVAGLALVMKHMTARTVTGLVGELVDLADGDRV